ncbi:pyruvate kinase [Candidatus Peregrinibacteria bacterium]|nr:pyruvate kinase [Candidatus Peregrinibacteria bacterium]
MKSLNRKKTKIVCTLGPSSDSVSEIVSLIQSGMNVARLNFSHGTYDHHKKIIENIHKAEKLTGKTIAILQDLQGPKIRIGKLPDEGIKVVKNQFIKLTGEKIIGYKGKKETVISLQHKGIIKAVKKGDTVLFKDGLIESKVVRKSADHIICKVVFGGLLTSNNGVNLPNSYLRIPTITEKDRQDLKFGLKMDVDFVALSFVKNAKDIENLRKLIEKSGKNPDIVAKIERHEAVKNLQSIIKATDAVMVARGDLGTDIPPEHVPIVQKRIIALSNKYGKPVITATQVLQSMITESIATRAEISDAANAVFDHTDAIMLSNETAVGRYAAKAAKTLTKVALTIEEALQEDSAKALQFPQYEDTDLIVVCTESGLKAKNIAKHRPIKPIIVVTPNQKTIRKLQLVWGINQIYKAKCPNDNEKRNAVILKLLKKEKILKKGIKITIIANNSQKESLISTIKI